MNITMGYNCKYSSGVAPFVFENDSWEQIYNTIILQNPCRITFTAPNEHEIGLFAYSTPETSSSSSITTSIKTTTVIQEQQLSTYVYPIAAAVIIAALIIAAYLFRLRAAKR